MLTPILFVGPVAIGIVLMKLISPAIGLLTCTALVVAASIYSLAAYKM